MALQSHIEGITPNIDSCGGMIAQKAYRAYRRIGDAHRRWIDPEDMVQEGLVAAVAVEKSFKEKGGAKFSTHLYTGLDWHFSRTQTGLTQQKRAGSIVELDAPIATETDTTGAEQLADPTNGGIDGAEVINYVNSFITLCRSVSQKAIVVLVRGLLFSDIRRATPEICAEIAEAAGKLHIGMADFKSVGQDEKVRKRLLTLVSADVTMGTETEDSLRCLECTECEGQFSVAAIRDGRFFISSMTCWVCHRRMQEAPAEVSCFGKARGNGHEGYSEADAECRLHCPDRVVCRKFVKGEMNHMVSADSGVKPALDDVDFSDIDVKKGKTNGKKTNGKKAKAEKPVKAEKAKKEPEVDDDPPPKGLSRWPFKKNSMMLWLFQQCLKGAAVKDLQKEVEHPGGAKLGYKWPVMLGAMRRLHRRHEFSWKLDEAGGRMRIYDVKELNGKKAEANGGKKANGKKAA